MTNEEAELAILRSVDKVTNQKSIAAEIGYSVGKVNYVLNGLIEKGLIKVDRFINSKSKVQYKYLLTPTGIKEKIALTDKFIEIKKEEYDRLQKQKKEYEEMYDLLNLNKCPSK
ncbi:MarR family EPS-associated transcriptional regulator [Sulfurimonas sp.]|uniref:MarR family EPS-associated transcriptional regulator n=1 Tax=Sulfurimonas sp. TaxID=2022749 RepID=UPI001A010253|nr:MarR family EPS-associated transcriptional regulator [Sulfurimonas sp.]MBE0515411.1 MarR family EPS-associated transcriptional regulator [Sulfurimonas sp.]